MKLNLNTNSLNLSDSDSIQKLHADKGSLPQYDIHTVSDSNACERNEIIMLRSLTFKLACDAAFTLLKKDDWNTKDFDTLVAAFIKIVGTQMKLDCSNDSLDSLIEDLDNNRIAEEKKSNMEVD